VSIANRLDRSVGIKFSPTPARGFVDVASRGLTIGAIVVGAGALIVWRFMPRAGRRGALAQNESTALGQLQLCPDRPSRIAVEDPAVAPQGDQGAPDAWITISEGVSSGLRDLRDGETVLILTWLDRARRDVLAVHPQGDPANPQ
jgi:hypothetical protein